MALSGKGAAPMSILKNRAKILSTGAVQKIVNEEMPGYRVVELEPASGNLREEVARKASRSLPSLVRLRQTSSGRTATAEADDAERGAADETEAMTEESLWGNSSQFVLVEPKGPATSSDTMARRRRTVIVSHGKIITEQG
jgi:hypothetical protein